MRRGGLKTAGALGVQKVCCGTQLSTSQALSIRYLGQKILLKVEHELHGTAAAAA